MVLTRNQMIQPFLKWAGGKRQLLSEIRKYIPTDFSTYYEPFIGAGAVLFDLQPQRAIISDVNADLIQTYEVIRDDVDALIEDLQKHQNSKEYFYQIRNLDRSPLFQQLTPVEKSSRLIYLNKTCFNGLFRVNRHGYFNVPYGRYKNPNIVNEQVLRAVHHYLNENQVHIQNTDFAETVAHAKKGDFIYLDPPYDPISSTASFTAYSLVGFGKEEQVRLRDLYRDLDRRGCKVLLSNSATDFIKDLYKEYHIEIVGAARTINAVAARRGKIEEVLVMNYDPHHAE